MDHSSYRVLGRTGIRVSPLCLGAMMFDGDGREGRAMIDRALDAGINFIDTADVYSRGRSEEIVGEALKGRRDDVVLATKCNGVMGEDPNMRGNSRRWVTRAVDDSLRRLQTDWIDLFQIHRPDPDTDVEETLAVLTDLMAAGKIRAIGSSTFPADQVVEAQWASQRRGIARFLCEQPPYSMLVREIERDVLPACQRYGMAAITWSPLCGGWLTGRWRVGAETPPSTRTRFFPELYDMELPVNRRKLEAVERLALLADEAGLTLIQMAIGFVLRHPAVTSPIIGPRTMEHLESQLAAADVWLSDDVLDRIDEIVPPGTTVNPRDSTYRFPATTDPQLRRRHRAEEPLPTI